MIVRHNQRDQLWGAGDVPHATLLQSVAVFVIGVLLGLYLVGAMLLPARLLYLAVLVALVPFLVMIVGSLRRILLAAILIEIPFQLDVNLFFDERIAAAGALPGLNISVTTLALAVLYGLWFAELLTGVRRVPRRLWRLCIPLLVYLLWVLGSVAVARNVELALYEVALLGQTFFLFVYIVGTVRTRQDVMLVVSLLLVGLVLESLVMIGLRVVGHSFSIGNISARIDGNGRVGGTIGSPISAASYLGLLLAPAISILLTRLSLPYKWLAAMAMSLGGVALIFTLSRGGWITFLLSATILCGLAWWRGWLSIAIVLAVLVVLAGLGAFYEEAILTRIFGDDGGSAEARPILMRLAWRMILDHPWLGVGANNFAVALPRYVTPEFSRAWLYVVHNKYLLVWSETGLGGLLAFLWFLGATLGRGWRSWHFKDRLLSPLALALTAAIVGHMVHMLVDVFHSRPQVQMLWLSAALITAIYSMGTEV